MRRVAEECIDGREFTVDAVVINGTCTSLATSIKYQYDYNPNITQKLYFTNDSDYYDLDALKKQNDLLVESMGLGFGLTHAEYRYRDGIFYLIEIAARGGGTRISSHIVPLMSGVDNYGLYIRQAVGDRVMDGIHVDEAYRGRKAVLEFFDFPKGRVRSVCGMDTVREKEGIIEVRLNFKEGDLIEHPSDDSKRPGFFIAYGDSEEELESLSNYVKDNLKIIYEEN